MARWPGSPVARRRAVLGLVILLWWAGLTEAMILAVPWQAIPTPTGVRPALAGRTACIQQPNLPDWPISVDREAFDAFQRGGRESDEELIEWAFTDHVCFPVAHGQAVMVVAVD